MLFTTMTQLINPSKPERLEDLHKWSECACRGDTLPAFEKR